METPWPVPPSSPNRANGKRRRSSVSGDSFERHAKHSCHPPPVSPSLADESGRLVRSVILANPGCFSSANIRFEDCNMTNFHEDCYEGVNSTSIQAKATFSFEYNSCNGVYQENFITSSQHGGTVNVEPVDQVLDLGDLHWRDNWQATLRALTRDQVKHHAKEACRSFNECMAHWLAARLFEASNQGEGYTCHENYDDFFIAEDDLIRNICWMV
ncbi:hypothetical protein CDV31_013449 [Fusarium ambrosium]|uniref:Uncharacterized protein n=1 Tax=Fusarium ambrosium TaxID=131363 RepID=A0A428T352_9HYPO|nr:hypothetical protein CDV31_013449 [Fusarium ambrosium]